MSSTADVTRGVRELHRLLREQPFDVRRLDLVGFREWLGRQRLRWEQDPIFVQRARIRDLRRAHPELAVREKAFRRAADEEAASPEFARLRQLDQELVGTDKAIAGLTAALKAAPPKRRPNLRHKLQAFRTRRAALRDEQAQLYLASPLRQTRLEAQAGLDQFRSAIGLDCEEARLDELLYQQGRRSDRSGASFEQRALTLTHQTIVPDLLRQPPDDLATDRLRVLQSVTLGAARIELDLVVVRMPLREEQPVEVLAVVEVKRNLNDLAHGFRRRQEDLVWLTGERDRYDPAQHRTAYFRSGHFDREAVHRQHDATYRFTRASFGCFQHDPAHDLILDRLYFITRAGPLWGVSTAALARISYRVATDRHWQPDNDTYLRGFMHWCQSLAEPIEAPDVLRLYTSTPRRGQQILLAGPTR